MKKYSVYLAILVLVLASFACQTVMGGGNNNFQVPDIQNLPEVPQTDGGDEIGIPTLPPVTTGDSGSTTVGGKPEFPVTSDAINVVTASNVVTFQTKMSTDDVLRFYRDEFASQGYKEDASMAITFGKTFTLAFTGHESGKVIYVVGADGGDGSLYVTITLG
jgi:hypothetical protein